MKYTCCIFDLDGTLINTVHALNRTIDLTLAHFGCDPIDQAHTKVFVGDGYKEFVKRALIYRGDTELTRLEEALPLYCRLFEDNCLYRIEAYQGMRELLDGVKERGMKIAVLTNKAQAQAVDNIETVYGKGYFDLITGEHPGMKRKPDPEGALYTARTLKADPGECLYVGDTNTDMMTGAAAGMDTVGVTWGFRPRGELEVCHPAYLAHTPADIIKIIKEQA